MNHLLKPNSKEVRARQLSREIAFKAVYAIHIGGMELSDAIEASLDGVVLSLESMEWVRELAGNVAGGAGSWDAKYQEQLSSNWPIERISVIDKLCLRMACCEIWNLPAIPPKVTIAEYLKLAEKYGSKESAAFINGILGKVLPLSPKAEWTPVEEEIPRAISKPTKLKAPSKKSSKSTTSAWVIKSEG